MFRGRALRRVGLLTVAAGLFAAAPAETQVKSKAPPRLEAVAETKLLMQGISQPNFKGLQRLLKEKPADVDSWTFARGQALLIAECGNLLLLRPPRNRGQDAWMDHATELRTAATRLARTTSERNYEASRSGLVEVTNACNRCHQTFRVATHLTPFDD